MDSNKGVGVKYEDPIFESVVYDGIRFLESLTRYYGSQKGMEVWNAMGESMGKEVKGKIFFAMLTGQTSGRLRFAAGTCTQAVPVIKTIRSATGLGLKEAKDIWDASRITPQVIEISPDGARDLSKSLRELGCIVF